MLLTKRQIFTQIKFISIISIKTITSQRMSPIYSKLNPLNETYVCCNGADNFGANSNLTKPVNYECSSLIASTPRPLLML